MDIARLDESEMKTNVTYWLDETALRFPLKAAFVDEKKAITFGELQRQARAIGTRIIKKGIFRKPVVVFLEKGVDTLTSFMGVAYSGNFYIPIDVDMPESRVDKILETLQPALIITSGNLLPVFSKFDNKHECLVFEDVDEAEGSENKIEEIRQKAIDTDLLYVLFTSGSTGIPKGVAITHRSVIDYIEWMTDTFSFKETDSFGNQAPFHFDLSVPDIYAAIKNGSTTYIIPKMLFSQPNLLLKYLKEKKINTIIWVPSALIVAAQPAAFRKIDLSDTLQRVLFCGEVMPNKQLNVWRKFLPKVLYVNLYGPAEITVSCTYYIVDREFADDEPLPIGIPAANTDILVLNNQNELVAVNEIGELCVRGTSLSPGYYNNPDRTRESFVQNPLNLSVPEIIYRTGDLVKYDAQGELIYLSRKDFQIKHLGHRIELGEIETAVSSLQDVALCCCLYDEKHHRIVLFLNVELDKAYVINEISKLIPQYMLPRKIITLREMPMNANGKIDRVKLKEFL